MNFDSSTKKVEALTNPRNVVLVGASDRPGSWSARVWRNLNRYGFAQPIYLVNPKRTEIWNNTCYPDFKSLPEPPDHLVVLVPAPGIPELLSTAAAVGARSATILSAGFGEAGDAQASAHGQQLASVIAETGLGVCGPNCMGNVCVNSRLVTLIEDRHLSLEPGPLALVGQSGGVMIFINHSLEERGLGAQYLITTGNELGLTLADYIVFFAGRPDLEVIIVYIESISNVEDFKAACRHARACGKTVVAIKLGQSESGRKAALAHTGALAGSVEAFDAVTAELGVIRAETIDDAIEIAELLVHTGAPPGPRLGAVTLSGAFRGLLLDAAERNNLKFPSLAPTTTEKLKAALSVGSLVSNPIDGGFGVVSSGDTYMACLRALQADPNIDAILLQEALPREPGSQRSEKYIRMVEDFVADGTKKPVAFVTLASHSQTEYSRALRTEAPHVSFLQEANKTLRAISAVVRRADVERTANLAVPARRSDAERAALLDHLRRLASNSPGPQALSETVSKEVLRAYGIATPPEVLAPSAAEAVAAADRLGYPVVLKGISPELTHKSDAGAVILDLRSAEAVGAAHQKIVDNVAAYGLAEPLDGVLVSRQISHGVELALGLHRDPEMGLVIMAGSGGDLLELVKDVAFCAPPVSREKAMHLIEQTRVAKLLGGYRGRPALDATAVFDALMALGCLATELKDVLDSVDINPFLVLPQGEGGVALDALIVLRPQA